MVTLDIYVQKGCFVCRRSLELAERVRRNFSEVVVHVIDSANELSSYRHAVIATPTFVLNDRVFSLGNPSEPELLAAIDSLLKGG